MRSRASVYMYVYIYTYTASPINTHPPQTCPRGGISGGGGIPARPARSTTSKHVEDVERKSGELFVKRRRRRRRRGGVYIVGSDQFRFPSLSLALATTTTTTTMTTTTGGSSSSLSRVLFSPRSLSPHPPASRCPPRPRLPSRLTASNPRCHCTALCLARAPTRPVLPFPIYTRIPPCWGLAPRTRSLLIARAGRVA